MSEAGKKYAGKRANRANPDADKHTTQTQREAALRMCECLKASLEHWTGVVARLDAKIEAEKEQKEDGPDQQSDGE